MTTGSFPKRPPQPKIPPKSLRDEFAMAALAGLYSNPGTEHIPPDRIAKLAFDTADHMMAAREARP